MICYSVRDVRKTFHNTKGEYNKLYRFLQQIKVTPKFSFDFETREGFVEVIFTDPLQFNKALEIYSEIDKLRSMSVSEVEKILLLEVLHGRVTAHKTSRLTVSFTLKVIEH